MLEIAILGGSGSGKTQISLELARQYDCVILSLDSLSVYKEINIASAKPSIKERGNIPHFGIDILEPSQSHNVQIFIQEYKKAKDFCKRNKQNLLIVGGTSFYLKSLLNGISPLPKATKERENIIQEKIQNLSLEQNYSLLQNIDEHYAHSIKPNDSYRIHKALFIYFLTTLSPSIYFKQNPPKPILEHCEIFEILLEKEILLKNVSLRTQKMLENGIIQEAKNLIQKYGKNHSWARSIGIKECLDFLDKKISESHLRELIITHTMQLTKRQRTFNKTQFKEHLRENKEGIFEEISKLLAT